MCSYFRDIVCESFKSLVTKTTLWEKCINDMRVSISNHLKVETLDK